MPTPFYHIFLAQTLLQSAILPEKVFSEIQRSPTAFYLGNIAPDLQNLCDLSRYETHFYKVHKPGQNPAEITFLETYPQQANVEKGTEQRAFIAGYCCHLQADQIWLDLIFNPFFGQDNDWAPIKRRAFIHNVFRTWLDLKIFPMILQQGKTNLAEKPKDVSLPFISNTVLDDWRSYLLNQLQLNSADWTARIFAKRLGIDPEKFIELLESKDRMQKEVFSRVPEYIIDEYIELVLEKNRNFLIQYL